MSMADDNTMRSYRANDPYGHDAIPSSEHDQAGGHDPLAELARLIGQNDPFADIGRGNPRAGEGRDPSHFAMGAPPSAPDWRRDAAPSYDAPMQPDDHADYQHDLRSSHFPPSTVPRHDHMSAASTAGLPADPYGDPHDQVAVQDRPYGDDRFEHDHASTAYGAGDPQHDPYYEDEAQMGPQDEEMYDDAPNARRRGGLLTVVTLVGCAMLGTAGAYGYRTYYVGAVPANPPVIVADKTPAKVVPPTDAQSSKAIQDRVGDQGGNERMVSHEEQPVELVPPGTQSSPRVVLPVPVTPMPSSSVAFPPPPSQSARQAPAAATPSPTPRSAAGNEPKRIRTVTIRPDGTDVAGKPVGGIGPSGSSPAPRAAAAQSRGGPLSLTPGSEMPAPAPVRSAPVTQAAPRLASAPSSAGAGGYMVQISSQRSEAEAHASYRAMQAKYQGVLGGHAGTVRRADLGAKGTFYRAMVGPFASAGEAGQLCSQLKAAGGQCIIQRN